MVPACGTASRPSQRYSADARFEPWEDGNGCSKSHMRRMHAMGGWDARAPDVVGLNSSVRERFSMGRDSGRRPGLGGSCHSGFGVELLENGFRDRICVVERLVLTQPFEVAIGCQ